MESTERAPQDVHSALTFAVVGGGASGVELATKMADLLNDAAQSAVKELAAPGTTLADEFEEHVNDFLNNRHRGERLDDILDEVHAAEVCRTTCRRADESPREGGRPRRWSRGCG